mmetsp:Transcript_148344/g.273720  ORF Transcript_148344/g.273720 Transcript_148344/m.273720 type:complete len:116 (-) Transcript_148344:211-558(-)
MSCDKQDRELVRTGDHNGSVGRLADLGGGKLADLPLHMCRLSDHVLVNNSAWHGDPGKSRECNLLRQAGETDLDTAQDPRGAAECRDCKNILLHNASPGGGGGSSLPRTAQLVAS